MVKIEILDKEFHEEAKHGLIKFRIINQRTYEIRDVAEFYKNILTEHLGYKERDENGIELNEEHDAAGRIKSFGIRRLPNQAANVHVYGIKKIQTFDIIVSGAGHLKRLMDFEKLIQTGKLEELVLD